MLDIGGSARLVSFEHLARGSRVQGLFVLVHPTEGQVVVDGEPNLNPSPSGGSLVFKHNFLVLGERDWNVKVKSF